MRRAILVLLAALPALAAAARVRSDTAAVRGDKNAAVNKVIEMLEGLRDKVEQEGNTEAKSYDTFACFCKDGEDKKNANIEEAEGSVEELAAKIEQAASRRDGLDESIKELNENIDATEKDMADMKKQRTAEHKQFVLEEAQLEKSVKGVTVAEETLGASGASFLQSKDVKAQLQMALLTAEALGLRGNATKKTASLLQGGRTDPTDEYGFHSDEIVSVLENLHSDFADKLSAVRETEQKAQSAYDKEYQTASDSVKSDKESLADKKKTREEKVEVITKASRDLSVASAALNSDRQYLQELYDMCEDAKNQWDQRSRARADEIQMLTKTMEILNEKVGTKTKDTVRFLQQVTRMHDAKEIVSDESAMEDIEAEAETADKSSSFVQVRASTRPALAMAQQKVSGKEPAAVGRKAIADMLVARGKSLRSAMLASLASQIAYSEDPFAKIKTLLQELIDRLLTEAQQEGEQKGWCDKAMADAQQGYDHALRDIKKFNASIAENSATIKKLTKTLDKLDKDTADLQTALEAAEDLRKKNKAENSAQQQEASEGLEGIKEAIDTLSQFYGKAKKNEFLQVRVQRGPGDDAPDKGFDSAYKGSQSASVGIMGMMDVIKSDFERTITSAITSERTQRSEFNTFKTDNLANQAANKADFEDKTARKDDLINDVADAEDTRRAKQEIFDTKELELEDLKAECVDTGMSFKERAARRDQEVDALKNAYCILEKFQEFGPDADTSGC